MPAARNHRFSSAPAFPAHWAKEVKQLLAFDFSRVDFAALLRELSRQIERDFVRREMVVVSFNGTVMFC